MTGHGIYFAVKKILPGSEAQHQRLSKLLAGKNIRVAGVPIDEVSLGYSLWKFHHVVDVRFCCGTKIFSKIVAEAEDLRLIEPSYQPTSEITIRYERIEQLLPLFRCSCGRTDCEAPEFANLPDLGLIN